MKEHGRRLLLVERKNAPENTSKHRRRFVI